MYGRGRAASVLGGLDLTMVCFRSLRANLFCPLMWPRKVRVGAEFPQAYVAHHLGSVT